MKHTNFKHQEALPEVARAIKRAYRKHRRPVSVAVIVPYLKNNRQAARTPSDKVAWFSQRWTIKDPKYRKLFEQFRQEPPNGPPPYFYSPRENTPGKTRRGKGEKIDQPKKRPGDESRKGQRLLKALAMSGFQQDPNVRKAIEQYSMRVAKKYFRMKRFVVSDTSATQPYDLVCGRSKSKGRIYVEVKGTQTRGEKVMLTANEVEHLRAHRRDHKLFVLHSLQLQKNGKPKGGMSRVIAGTEVLAKHLRPIAFELTLPLA